MAGIFKKSDEERALEKAASEASQAKEKAEAQHRAWLTTPIGMATSAKESGNGFFEIELEIGGQKIDKHYGHWLQTWSELTEFNPSGAIAHASKLSARREMPW